MTGDGSLWYMKFADRYIANSKSAAMPIQSRPVKIWYQSFVDPGHHAAYFSDLTQSLREMVEQGVEFDIHGIVPPDLELHRLTEFRCARQVIRNAIAAQQQGYDAFAIGHFQDGGLYEARATVDIPVLGLGEAAMLYACMLGQKIALVTINPSRCTRNKFSAMALRVE